MTIPNYSPLQSWIISFSCWNDSHCSLLMLCWEKLRCRQVCSDPQSLETISTVSILATWLSQAWRVCWNLLSYGSCLFDKMKKSDLARVSLDLRSFLFLVFLSACIHKNPSFLCLLIGLASLSHYSFLYSCIKKIIFPPSPGCSVQPCTKLVQVFR